MYRGLPCTAGGAHAHSASHQSDAMSTPCPATSASSTATVAATPPCAA
jgi:hypothetical protein